MPSHSPVLVPRSSKSEAESNPHSQLLSLFDKVADAPEAIPRLRRFILDLAVRGKLVEQDPKDEPAAKLLKRIAAEKERLVKDKKIKKPKALPPIEIDAEPYGIDANWNWKRLGELGYWAIGGGFPKNEQGKSGLEYFFLKVSDMNLPGNEKFIKTANNTIDKEAQIRIRARIHEAGTIIFPKIGGAIATNKRRILTQPSAIDNNCLGMRFYEPINIEWAYLIFLDLDLTEYQSGTATPALQQSRLELIEIPLPPLAEQKRIVAKVDELMTLCDQLEAQLTTIQTESQQLLEACLREALA